MAEGDFYCYVCQQQVSKWHRIPMIQDIDPKMELYKRVCINCWPTYKTANGLDRPGYHM